MASTATAAPKVYILHENSAWVEPLRASLDARGTQFEEWFIHEGQVVIGNEPPPGVFYNRMSASSHTRGHRHSVELTAPILRWLETYGRRVVNKSRALQLEVSKIDQYLSLQQHGLRTPRTTAAVGREAVLAAARDFAGEPFVIKPNRGGKGLGVSLFETFGQLETYLHANDPLQLSLDGVLLVQQYVPPADGHIVRMEFIGGRFFYAVKVDSTNGFELCPADECDVDSSACPADQLAPPSKFSVLDDFDIPEIPLCEAFLAVNDIEIAGIEYSQDASGTRYIYDVNTNTNYNSSAEQGSRLGKSGMDGIADFLTGELNRL